jgi:hypothetical protein
LPLGVRGKESIFHRPFRFDAFEAVDPGHNFSPAIRIKNGQQERQQMKVNDRKKRRSVESQILPPDVPLFILKDEAQRIRPACLKEESTTPNNFVAVEIRAIQAHGPVAFTEAGGRSGGRCRIPTSRYCTS